MAPVQVPVKSVAARAVIGANDSSNAAQAKSSFFMGQILTVNPAQKS
jgi:hypothetical protein